MQTTLTKIDRGQVQSNCIVICAWDSSGMRREYSYYFGFNPAISKTCTDIRLLVWKTLLELSPNFVYTHPFGARRATYTTPIVKGGV
jgi:hypothetical protein